MKYSIRSPGSKESTLETSRHHSHLSQILLGRGLTSVRLAQLKVGQKYSGKYSVVISRVTFLSQENVQLLVEMVPEDNLRDTCRKLEETTAVSIQANQDVDQHKKEFGEEYSKDLGCSDTETVSSVKITLSPRTRSPPTSHS